MTFAVAVPATPAAAQNVLETLFGGLRRPPPPRVQISTPTDLFRSVFRDPTQRNASPGAGPSSSAGLGGGIGPRTAYCVRLCDGRYFPLQPQRNASAVQQCDAFCPATETKVFSGSGIDHAVASNGRRYADLPNAYLYRKSLVPGCSCSRTGTSGVATVPVDEDTTLRPGDIVAGNSGFTVYRGRDHQQHPQFTPIELANVSRRVREQLAGVKIAPPLPSAASGETAQPAKAVRPPADREQAMAIPESLRLSARRP